MATNDPWTSSCQRLRRLAPSTSWVAFSRRANDAIASAVSWSDDVVDGAAEFADELALRGERSVVRLREAVVDGDMDADEFATDAARHARRAPDERVATGDAGEPDDHPLAGLPRFGDAVGVEVAGERFLDAVGDPQQARVRAGRRGCRAGSSWRARRRRVRRGRCCRGPSVGGSPRGPCRRVRAGRPGGRCRRAPSRVGRFR